MTIRASIIVSEGPEKGSEIELESGKLVIGRAKGDLKLTDKKVSSQHCELEIVGDKLYLTDLHSTNGTFLGSKKVTDRIELQNLDVITIGLSRIKVLIVEELEDFKKANLLDEVGFEVDSNTLAEAGASSDNRETRAPETQIDPDIQYESPDPNAEYRTTGVQRIESLITDEMAAFSKWDDAGMKDTSDQLLVPKIQVILVARKAPEGVTQINCSEEKTTIGRKGVDVRLNDLDLSRKHACIEIVNRTTAYVRDLASTNGTYVNGNKISFQEINNGDLIQFGQSVFEVQIQQVKS